MTSGASCFGRSDTPSGSDPDKLDPVGAAHRSADREWSEYSWGGGLTPKGNENVGPAEGGRYHTRVPGVQVRP